jgi:hypothetical protein
MQEKFLKRAAAAALDIEDDLDMPIDALDKKIFSIFISARRWRADVEEEVRELIARERRERNKERRERERVALLILILVVCLEEARAREMLIDAEVCRVVDGLKV